MSASFNVLSEGWIPVVDLENRRQKLGILDTLKNAHRLKAISDASAMVEYSLYRFLSVFLMDALRPKDMETLEDLLEEGSFDAERIDDYIALCRNEGVSFDLFDKERPFLQAKYDPERDKKQLPVGKLDLSLPHGNNHLHFEHNIFQNFTYDRAARTLISSQVYCGSDGSGYKQNVYGAAPTFVIVRGKTLFETLLFSLVPIDKIEDFDSEPVWWRNRKASNASSAYTRVSWLLGMMFPARRISLIVPDNGSPLSKVYYSPGNYLVTMDLWKDPFVGYIISNSGKKPITAENSVACWRNLKDLLRKTGRPQILEQYICIFAERKYIPLSVYEVKRDKAKIEFERKSDVILPQNIMQNDDSSNAVIAMIRQAEQMGDILVNSMCVKRMRKGKLESVPIISQSANSELLIKYYGECEKAFWKYCDSISKNPEKNTILLDEWKESIRRIACKQRDETISTFKLSAKMLRDLAEKEINKIQKGAVRMENKTNYESFLKRVDALSAGDRVALKRSAGVMLSEADGKAIAAFYRCITPEVPRWQEDRWFAAACMKCLWDPAEGTGKPVETVLADLIRGAELSDSMQHRVEGLLDTQWDQDGYMLTKLCRIMKLIQQKTSDQIDFANLLEDLIYWNNENQSVQRKWARAIFSTNGI